MIRLLVCGGRDFNDEEMLFTTLNNLRIERGLVEVVIHGAARGADTLADDWANSHNIDVISVPADWRKYGKAAGPMRNAEMLRHEPDLVVAFPGGNGTRNMVKLARAADIEVLEVEDE